MGRTRTFATAIVLATAASIAVVGCGASDDPPAAEQAGTGTTTVPDGPTCPGSKVGETPLEIEADDRATDTQAEGWFNDVAVAPDGRVFVLGQHSIWCIDGTSVHEAFSLAIGTVPEGEEESEFSGIAVDGDGIPVVVDLRNPRAWRLVDGELVPIPGTDDPEIGGSRSVAVGPDGTIYLTGIGSSGSTIVWAVEDGAAKPFAGAGPYGTGGDGGPAIDASLSEPEGLAVDDDGVLYVADRNNLRVVAVSNDGTLETLAGGKYLDDLPDSDALDAPNDVAVNAAGDVYVLDLELDDDRPGIFLITGRDVVEGVVAGPGTCSVRFDGYTADRCPVADYDGGELTRFDVTDDGEIWAVADTEVVHIADGEVGIAIGWF